MNLEKRLQSAAQELNESALRTSPPPLRPASEPMRPWMAFAAALAVVLAVFGIPYALTNFGQGAPPDSSPLAGAGSTSTTECVLAETTTTIIGEGDVVSTLTSTTGASEATDETTIIGEGDVVSTLTSTTGASEATDEEPDGDNTDCVEPVETTTTTMIEPTTTPVEACQAEELYPPTTVANGDPSYDLTEPVAEKLTAIAEAAAACNATGLAALASDDITTTFGPGSGPEDIASWEPDDERFGIIAELFNMTHGVTEIEDGSRHYVWPAAFAYETWEEIPTAAMDELLRIYTQKELDQISQLGSYGGWRIGITETGEWIFYVAGD